MSQQLPGGLGSPDARTAVRSLRRHLAKTGLPPRPRITEHPRSGRNRLFVVSGGGRRWLAKASLFQAESWFYDEVGPRLDWVPGSVPVTNPNLVLIDYHDGLPSIHDVSRDKPSEAIGMLVGLAPALAQLHGWPVDGTAGEVPAGVPAMPQLDPVHVSAWTDSSAASQYFLGALHQRERLCQVLHEAGAGAGPQGLIHGDLKADNVLWSSGEPLVLDWELCGRGYVGWDLGAVIGSILAIWIEGVRLEAPREAWFDEAAVPFAEVSDAACQFLTDYGGQAPATMPSRAVVVAYTASWLLGRAWAESRFGRQVNPRHLLRLVIAEGLVRNPHALLRGLA